MAPCGSCGGRSNASQIEYQAKANDGTVKLLPTNTEAKIYLASHGGGTVKAVPRKKTS